MKHENRKNNGGLEYMCQFRLKEINVDRRGLEL